VNILIVKTSSLGDIIHSYSVLSYLKEKYPDAVIDFVVEKPFAEVVLKHPFVSNVIEIDTRSWRKSFLNAWKGIRDLRRKIRKKTYDVSFDLQCNSKSGLIVSLVKAKNKVGFGFKTAIEWPNCFFNGIRFNPGKELNVRDENLYIVKQFFKDESAFADSLIARKIQLKISDDEKQLIDRILLDPSICNKPIVMVSPGSNWKNKQISEETMILFLKKVEAHLSCSFIFTSGSMQELAYVQELKKSFPNALVLDKLNLCVLQNLMAKMDLVIAMDSLPLHLAATAGTATFSFFGPSSSSKYMPLGKNHAAFQGSCPYGRVIERRCPVLRTCKTGACLKASSADAFFQAFTQNIK